MVASLDSSDPLLTRKEVCFHRGGISRWTLWRWQQRGLKIVAGRVRMSTVESFLEDLERRRQAGRVQAGPAGAGD